MTGSYTAALNVGSMLTLTATGPLVTRFGWQIALAVWAVLPLIAAVVWVPLAQRPPPAVPQRAAPHPPAGSPGAPASRKPGRTCSRRRRPGCSTLLRRPTTWMLTIAFAGQAFAYYGLTAWLPTLLADEQGMTRDQAGAASSIFQICALIGALGTPIIINRFGGPLSAFLVIGALWSTLPLGLLFASDLWAVWSALAGHRPGWRIRRGLHRGGAAGREPAGEPSTLGDCADRRLRGGQPRPGDPRRTEREHRRLGLHPLLAAFAGHLRA